MAVVYVLLVLLAGVGGVILVLRAERQRTEALARVCQSLGFAFQVEGDADAMRALADLPLFGHGHSRRVRNVMAGQLSGREVRLFDYRYRTGSGKHSHTWSQTVLLCRVAGPALPDFVLAPERVFHKIGQIFGYQDIDFDSNPEFSSQYLLRGGDVSGIKGAFGPDILSYFAMKPGWTVETRSGHIGVYRSDHRCRPDEVQAFLTDAERILLLFGL